MARESPSQYSHNSHVIETTIHKSGERFANPYEWIQLKNIGLDNVSVMVCLDRLAIEGKSLRYIFV